MVTISEETQAKLARMQELNVMMQNDFGFFLDDSTATEFRSIQSEMVKEFLPLIETLVGSALLSVAVDLEVEDEAEKFSILTGDPYQAIVSGNICLSCEFSGGGIRPSA